MKSAKEILSNIVECINAGSPDSQELWRILLSLRECDANQGGAIFNELTRDRILGVLGFKQYKPKPLLSLTEVSAQMPLQLEHGYSQAYTQAVESIERLGFKAPERNVVPMPPPLKFIAPEIADYYCAACLKPIALGSVVRSTTRPGEYCSKKCAGIRDLSLETV